MNASWDAAPDQIVDAPESASQRLPVESLRRPVESAQYTSFAFGHRCREAGIAPSMGAVGSAYDNAMAESFFASLECELLDRSRFETREEARVAVFDYLEAWYNPRRRHSALAYASPAEFARRFAELAIT